MKKPKCHCYIGETESLGTPMIEFCALHKVAPQMADFLSRFVQKARDEGTRVSVPAEAASEACRILSKIRTDT